ncbi:PAS domain S-box protein, partial [Calidithermus terrae]|uniref:PAS domain S-box protein n=1 Tax=Calidithermus terrae TaxID=1408545 RepID=UPI000E64ED47
MKPEQPRPNLLPTPELEPEGVGWWQWDVVSDTHHWTAGFERLLGLEPGTFRGGVEAFLERVHPDDRPRISSMVEANLREGWPRPREFEYRVALPGGQVRWVSSRAIVIHDAQGQALRVVGVEIDVTERKLAEERFRRVVESIPNALLMVSREGRVVLTNSEAERLFGYGREELLGMPVESLVPERFRQQHRSRRAGFLADPQARAMGAGRELFALRKDGREVPVEIGLNPMHTPEGDFALISVIDISERRRAEERLRESEARFRTLADTAPVMVWMSGADGLCDYFNTGWLNFTGRPLEQELGNGWVEGVHPDDRERCLGTYATAFDRREPFEMEYRLRRHDGQYRWIVDRAVPRYTPGGEFLGYIGACIDIHERKRAEERLRALQEVTARLAGAQTLAEVGQVLLEEVLGALGANGGGLRLVTPQGLVLEEHVLGTHADAEAARRFGLVPLDALHPAAEAARTGEPVFHRDRRHILERYPHFATDVARLVVEANAHLPLRRGEEVFGVLSLSFAEPCAWDEGERAFALALADRTAIAYERARLFEEERQARRRAEALQAVSAALARASTPQEVCEAATREGATVLGARTGALFLREGATLRAVARAAAAPVDPGLRERYYAIPLDSPIPAADTARDGHP